MAKTYDIEIKDNGYKLIAVTDKNKKRKPNKKDLKLWGEK